MDASGYLPVLLALGATEEDPASQRISPVVDISSRGRYMTGLTSRTDLSGGVVRTSCGGRGRRRVDGCSRRVP